MPRSTAWRSTIVPTIVVNGDGVRSIPTTWCAVRVNVRTIASAKCPLLLVTRIFITRMLEFVGVRNIEIKVLHLLRKALAVKQGPSCVQEAIGYGVCANPRCQSSPCGWTWPAALLAVVSRLRCVPLAAARYGSSAAGPYTLGTGTPGRR